MIKSELIASLADEHPQLSHRDVERVVAAVVGEMADALVRGDRIELRGFGAFTVKTRDPRIARNPKTGEPVPVPEKRAPHFKAGKELRERLNAGYAPAASNARDDAASAAAAAETPPATRRRR